MREPCRDKQLHAASPRSGALAAGFLLLAMLGCDRTSPPPAAAKTAASPTIASLVPAATDMLLGMGAGDHLVAVSDFDQPRAATKDLPRVGDYRTINWEKLAELRPAVMIVQFRADKMPAGLEDRAKAYGIRLVNIKIVRLTDIFPTLAQLGEAAGEQAKANKAAADLRSQLQAVRTAVAGRPRVRTYIGRTDNPLEAVGGGNFVDDLLSIAGGQNVLSGPGYDDNSYPTVDRELLLSLNPDAALNLLPGASPQALEKAKQFWATMPSVSAVSAGRVHYLTDDDLLWPGLNVGKVAERFAAALHPGATTKPATRSIGFQPMPPIGRPLPAEETASRHTLSVPHFKHGRDARVTDRVVSDTGVPPVPNPSAPKLPANPSHPSLPQDDSSSTQRHRHPEAA